MNDTNADLPIHERNLSTFVNVVAWIFTVMSSLGAFANLLQSIMWHLLVVPSDTLSSMPPEQVPPLAETLFQNMGYVSGAMLVFMLASAAISFNLYQRREWARKSFIGLMLLGILFQLAGAIWAYVIVYHYMAPLDAPNIAPEVKQMFDQTRHMMLIISAVFALVLSSLFGWIAWKLQRPSIRAEFR